MSFEVPGEDVITPITFVNGTALMPFTEGVGPARSPLSIRGVNEDWPDADAAAGPEWYA